MSAPRPSPLPDLDAWLPRPAVRTHRRRDVAASADRVWHAAREVRLHDTRALGRLVRWRIPGTSGDQTFREMFARYPFTVLDEGETWSVSGLCGRIWTLARDYPRLDDPEAFRSWDASGTARVLFAHWVEPGDDGRSTLFSEARVAAVDRTAALRLRGLWLLVGQFERVIGAEPLPLAVRRAEAA